MAILWTPHHGASLVIDYQVRPHFGTRSRILASPSRHWSLAQVQRGVRTGQVYFAPLHNRNHHLRRLYRSIRCIAEPASERLRRSWRATSKYSVAAIYRSLSTHDRPLVAFVSQAAGICAAAKQPVAARLEARPTKAGQHDPACAWS
jgi:hypothetical protein